jgi:hypothetical protein
MTRSLSYFQNEIFGHKAIDTDLQFSTIARIETLGAIMNARAADLALGERPVQRGGLRHPRRRDGGSLAMDVHVGKRRFQ